MNKIIYYYQTFVGLKSLLMRPITTTHIIVSSIHFGRDNKENLYIHLNDYKPDDKKFISVWEECKEASDKNITIMIMIGGAGGAYQTFFESNQTYIECYQLLLNLIKTYPFIKGIDLDIEEDVSITNVKRLIHDLNYDFGNEFIITMAPVASSLMYDYPGLGGFCYKDLLNSEEGKRINWFNGQFYFQYDKNTYDSVIENGYNPEKVVMGMISSGQNNLDESLIELKKIKAAYPKFSGVYNWEYFNSPPEPSNPYKWSEIIYSILK